MHWLSGSVPSQPGCFNLGVAGCICNLCAELPQVKVILGSVVCFIVPNYHIYIYILGQFIASYILILTKPVKFKRFVKTVSPQNFCLRKFPYSMILYLENFPIVIWYQRHSTTHVCL